LLEVLDRHIKYKQVACEEEVWEAERRALEVSLPYQLSPKHAILPRFFITVFYFYLQILDDP
jgi:hypothetical protein